MLAGKIILEEGVFANDDKDFLRELQILEITQSSNHTFSSILYFLYRLHLCV